MNSGSYSLSIPIIGRVRCCLELLFSQNIKGKKIADIGCTFGWLERELKNSGATIDGIDPNHEAISFAKKNRKGRNINFWVGDALNIPLKNSSYDLTIFFDVIEHLPKNKEIVALKEINRILKKDGVLLLTTPNSHPMADILDPAWYFGHRHYGKSQITNLLRKSGFKVVSYQLRGNIFSLIYILWFYFNKWILGSRLRNGLLEQLDDKGYQMPGIATIYLKAQKMKSIAKNENS